ncbi:pirin family protein, partial [Nocardioides sp.]|uniref:pirin family protein n=1 Tax=Nocardioides sp. TaxID=35761 RepID=UPI002B267E1E
MTVEIRRASDAFTEKGEGRLTRHSFSFGSSYDPDNLRFGPMTCHDDHLLGLGRGFDSHRHSDLVIVSWVVSGALDHLHESGSGSGSEPVTVLPGQAAVLSTGPGVDHSERASAPATRFVQVWLAPGEGDLPAESSYDVLTPSLETGALTRVAEPVPGAVFSVARLEAGQSVEIPAAPRAHVYVARGALTRSSMAEPLQEGDAFRFTDE